MAYEIKMLDLIDIELESSFLVLARNMGIRTRVKTWGYLILGADAEPILVDTGASHPEIMETPRDDGDRDGGDDAAAPAREARASSSTTSATSCTRTTHIDHAGQDHELPDVDPR